MAVCGNGIAVEIGDIVDGQGIGNPFDQGRCVEEDFLSVGRQGGPDDIDAVVDGIVRDGLGARLL